MTRREAIVLGSRLLATLMTIWALTEVCYLFPEVHSFARYAPEMTTSSSAVEYWRHHYLIEIGFTVTRIIGYSLMSVWLYKGGPEIDELLLPIDMREG